jgi:hypothetical protein
MSRAGWVILDTTGKLHVPPRLWAWCCSCASFEIDIAAPITERGADCEIIGMAPVRCPRCHSGFKTGKKELCCGRRLHCF